MPAVRVERPHEAVASHLRQGILSGKHRPGERLPIERDLSEHFQVSRSVVRQALLLLEHQGLVRVRSGVGGGPFVTHNALPTAIAAFENVLAVEPDSIADFARAKLVLEPAVNAMAAEMMTPAVIAALEANLAATREQIEAHEDSSTVLATVLQFHTILVRATRNRYLVMMIEILGEVLDRLPDGPSDERTDPWRLLDEHEQMLDALRVRDVDAVRDLTCRHMAGIWHNHLTNGT